MSGLVSSSSKAGRGRAEAFITEADDGRLQELGLLSPSQGLHAREVKQAPSCFWPLLVVVRHLSFGGEKTVIAYLCMVGRMKSMDAMKPFTKFMMVLKMYTKECLQCMSKHLSLLDTTFCDLVTGLQHTKVHLMLLTFTGTLQGEYTHTKNHDMLGSIQAQTVCTVQQSVLPPRPHLLISTHSRWKQARNTASGPSAYLHIQIDLSMQHCNWL